MVAWEGGLTPQQSWHWPETSLSIALSSCLSKMALSIWGFVTHLGTLTASGGWGSRPGQSVTTGSAWNPTKESNTMSGFPYYKQLVGVPSFPKLPQGTPDWLPPPQNIFFRFSTPVGCPTGVNLHSENETLQSNRNDFPKVTFTLNAIWRHVWALFCNWKWIKWHRLFKKFVYVRWRFFFCGCLQAPAQSCPLPDIQCHTWL
jgi:hypothetical protein